MGCRRIIGCLILLLGIVILIIDERHCDASRFVLFCFCLMMGLPLVEKKRSKEQGCPNP
nr:MAG TPA: hypothetical protein [Caudoviricetes sp.]